MKLCLALGYTRKRLLDEMDAPELTLWMARQQLDPLPDSWEETGLLCSTTANFSLRSARESTPDDWIPRIKERKNPGAANAMKSLLDLAAASRRKR